MEGTLASITDFIGATEVALVIVPATLLIIPLWKICKKIGYPGWYSLAALLPVLNIIALYILAFIEWPIERREH